ncbi:hypothetical protein GGI25_004670 [Coemansia spiralis]|uniref:protein O-GlcNAc transferase n=2 Tax=Coemansia TaxID=4863 RepID=A0A9W8G5N0_9FUNG|nr:hypothetical protein EDC05_006127 [Coemansia umbellata]KAJ2620548.1 hypothetical protein GGI26_004890 [Coemansia sp. RSA 1358]KAJ2673569.1 hypothetical protein GGI25_004670 [Coemansia spiralis]
MSFHFTQPGPVYNTHEDIPVADYQSQIQQSSQSNSSGAHMYNKDNRTHRKASYVMDIDTPTPEHQQSSTVQPSYDHMQQSYQQIGSFQNTQYAPMQSDYYSYGMTTVQMVDPWAFNHASLLANLSQLPPDLLPSFMPHINNQQQQPQQNGTQNMTALAAAAAVAAAAAAASGSVPGASIPNQQLIQNQHGVNGMVNANSDINNNVVLPSISTLPHTGMQQPNQQQQQQQQQQQYVHQQNPYGYSVYYGSSALQPLMVPPPSPTILSYYKNDPNRWMSLLGQQAYQPQAYHYDYPLPPHQISFNFQPSQQQQLQQPSSVYGTGAQQGSDAMNGSAMLLTQQFVPPQQNQLASVSLPSIDQALHPNNAAVAVAAAAQLAAAAAAASGQYTQQAANSSGVAFGTPQAQLPSDNRQGAAAYTASHLSQQLLQPTRRSSSFTNLALLQQQSHSSTPNSFVNPAYGSLLFQKPDSVGVRSQQNATGAVGQGSVFSGFNNPSGLADLQYQAQSQQKQHFGSGAESYSGVGGYGSGIFGASDARQKPLSSTRSHGGMPPMSRISLTNRGRHGYSSLLSGPKSASAAMKPASAGYGITNASSYLGSSALSPASSSLSGFGHISIGSSKQDSSSTEFVPGTRIKRQLATSDSMRDHILQMAHQLNSSNPRNPMLLEMLLCLHSLHPRHLPTLLLIACVYFSNSQPEKCLEYNERILKIDPTYVEAMYNIGATLRSLGKVSEAESWWWRAVKLRPGYWDVVDHLMASLCNTNQPSATSPKNGKSPGKQQQAATRSLRYCEALQLCEFVDKSLRIGEEPSRCGTGTITKYQVRERDISRLQSLFYSEGNLRSVMGDVNGARREYVKAMEVVLGGYKLDDIIVRIAYIGAQEGINQMFHQQLNNQQPPSHNLNINSLPLTLLAPENAVRIMQFLFPDTQGVLPGFVALSSKATANANGTATSQLQQANQFASNLLLILAKMHQDHAVVAQPLSIVLPLYYMSLSLWPSPSTCNNMGIILSAIPSPSTPTMVPSLQGGHQAAQAPMGSALAMQYYTHGLTLDSRHPHLYTNLGSLLKDLGYLAEAVRMYEKAVEFNPTFDVALANLGNAIKDMGRVQDSVPWYLRAVQASPNFVEAVCGLANAMAGVCDWRARDGLYTEIAVRWHAIALANDEMAINIFQVMGQGKRPTAKEYVNKLHKLINFVPAPRPKETGDVDKRRGWMDRVVEIVDQQLSDGRQWCHGLLLSHTTATNAADGSKAVTIVRPTSVLIWLLDGLCQLVPKHSLAPLSSLAVFLHNALSLCREVANISETEIDNQDTLKKWGCFARQLRNEGGWALRLIERVMIVQQRQWYWEAQHNKPSAVEALANPQASGYQRPRLPTGMAAPAVPTVLPFHTFTYPLDSREIRLISHRNAMRLSFTTLGGSAPWLPSHIYPPPPPPDPLLRIGYVSSDFNNHPLSHLMQSVFGMHDRSKFQIYCYATTPPDGTLHRQKIEGEADVFINCAAWSTQRIVEQIVNDKIHVLVNLNGYTKGARNEIFAARPAPVLVAFMGFAGTLGAGWCDYVVTDPIVCPPWTVRCEVRAERRHRAVKHASKRRPEMQEVQRSNGSIVSARSALGGSREMAERNGYSADTGHADAAGYNSDSDSDYDYDYDYDYDSDATSENMHKDSQNASSAMSRSQRQKEWAGDLPWDFGELDPEEDGMFTGELYSFDTNSKDELQSAQEAFSKANFQNGHSISSGKFNFIDKVADQRKDEAGALDWVYTERMIYMPHTYFVNDHRQGFRVDEELRGIQTADELWITEQDARYKMRHEIFPQISDDVFIFANFNQLYKIDPTLFRMWLRVLERVPNAIIWLLRFPAAGEEHLHRAAVEWAGEEVARRVVFTDVAPKHIHIKRGRVADAFLDTPECNAHTTAVDILWSGTPVLTWPRHEHKLCSRVAASVACATGHGRQMVVSSADEYVDKAVEWATTLSYEYQYVLPMAGQQTILSVDPQTGYMKRRVCHGPVMELRKQLFMRRDRSRLFDTLRWTRNLERGLTEAWRRWVTGEDDVEAGDGGERGASQPLQRQKLSVGDKREQQQLASKADRRKARWCKRIELEMDEALGERSIGRGQPTVYAPAGRCIWVIDEDDAMPSHSWVREMIGW